ncbi:MAG: hypothetical protein WBE96_19910, partial [Pseudolabrys sp.]
TALAYVGATVVVDGSTAQLTGGNANWSLNVTKPSTATITIKDSTGQNVYTGTLQSIPARRVSPGTAAATTAVSGPTAPIPSPPQSTPTSNRLPFQRYRRS